MTASTVLPKALDFVTLSKAELVVKSLSLKEEATGNLPNALITIFNSVTGQSIGTMTNSGVSGTGAKYSFQGTVPRPVTTLLLKSSMNGTATGSVAHR